MDNSGFENGARVFTRDGQEVGTVIRQHGSGDDLELVIQLTGSDRTIMAPVDVVDFEASTPDELVIVGDYDEVTTPRMNVGEHERQTMSLSAEEAVAHVHDRDRGRLLIDRHVEMVPHRADVDVGTDRVDVERVPVGEIVDEAPQVREEGDVLIVPVIEEVLVVTKRFRVIEEVRVTKTRDVRTETFEQDLKREVVTVTEEDEHGEPVKR